MNFFIGLFVGMAIYTGGCLAFKSTAILFDRTFPRATRIILSLGGFALLGLGTSVLLLLLTSR